MKLNIFKNIRELLLKNEIAHLEQEKIRFTHEKLQFTREKNELLKLKEKNVYTNEDMETYITLKKGTLNNQTYLLICNKDAFMKLFKLHNELKVLQHFKSQLIEKNVMLQSEINNSKDGTPPEKIEVPFENLLHDCLANQYRFSYEIEIKCYLYIENQQIAACGLTYHLNTNTKTKHPEIKTLSSQLKLYKLEIFHEEYRNMGIGSEILKYIKSIAYKLEVQAIIGTAQPLDNTICPNRLTSFYEKNGFTIIDRHTGEFKLTL